MVRYIRPITLIISTAIAIVAFVFIKITIPFGTLQTIRLTQIYALLAVIYLYFTLLASPLYHVFPSLPTRGLHIKARRALGQSTFLFAALHVYFAFFGQLGGFMGLGFLTGKYLFAITLSFIALIILTLMAITSFDRVVRILGRRWKLLHRFVYLAGILILTHALILGSHFSNLSSLIPQIFLMLIAILLILESIRLDSFLLTRFKTMPRLGISFTATIVILLGGFISMFFPQATGLSLNIHAQHIQLAQQAQNGSVTIPGLNGDRTKRYTVSMAVDQTTPQPNQDVTIHFKVYDASNGNPVTLFRILYAWPMHFMIVDNTLSYFAHIHPKQMGSEFVITTQFPQSGFYHLYIQFYPFGGIEQQMAFTLPVGISKIEKVAPATQPLDHNLTKVFGDYEVTLDTHGRLNAKQMTLGKNTLSFTVKDAKTKKPITTLKPFMASFGHLTMINEQTYDFIHVHPYSLTVPPPNANGGPTVDFLPIGIYGPFKPGTYRAFAEFSTQIGTDFDANFTIKIE